MLAIIDNCCRVFKFPDAIKSVLFMFSRVNKAYSSAYGGQFHGANIWVGKGSNIWVDHELSLCIGADGTVYSCSNSRNGKLELGEGISIVNTPKQTHYFTENGIEIVDIVLGCNASSALDINDRIYSWGDNEPGECGRSIHKH